MLRVGLQGPYQWAVEASVEVLARVRADVDEVAEWVHVDYSQALSSLLPFTPDQVPSLIPT